MIHELCKTLLLIAVGVCVGGIASLFVPILGPALVAAVGALGIVGFGWLSLWTRSGGNE